MKPTLAKLTEWLCWLIALPFILVAFIATLIAFALTGDSPNQTLRQWFQKYFN